VKQINFETAFEALTSNAPFPWQKALYERFVANQPDNIPASCNLPTGLGKTSVIAIWLIALANYPQKMPRRLVYVVNRRTVVDQTTDEVEKYKKQTIPGIPDFAVSTLRGRFADNRDWSADPSRPAVICGTVDMIGSRLLFSGYGVGMKAKPLHAGFLGQDSLIVHDEAHLEPAFQTLLEAIRDEQARCKDFRPLRVMELTATSRGSVKPFGLTDEDKANSIVLERITAKKTIHLELVRDEKKLAEQLADKAATFADKGRAIIVFTRKVDDVLKIRDKLPNGRVVTLTGTMRGKERDDLVNEAIFKRFMPGSQSDKPTVYLVCTSAGEVGVNISGDHLVCDLSTFDSMAQRFGRVNRFGKRFDTEVHVIHPTEFEEKEYHQRRKKTLHLLRELNGDGSPDALGRLDPVARQAAFAPLPVILPATDILFDAWALTSITEKLPGRPPVEPYLHGLPTEWQPPETQVAWRREVEEITGELLDEYDPQELLDTYPLKPHEMLKEPSHRAFKHFEALAKRCSDDPVWLIDDTGAVEVLTMRALGDKDRKELINGKTVLLPPSVGGLEGGMLNGTSPAPKNGSLDVADEWFIKNRDGTRIRQRKRLWLTDPEDDPEVADMHSILTVTFPGGDEDAEEKTWQWFVMANEGDKSAKLPVLWEVHVRDVVARAEQIAADLSLDKSLQLATITSAEFHDHGKKRRLFQTMLGNADPQVWLAKSGKKGGRVSGTYRHEFGSLLDVDQDVKGDHRELIMHLIAAHHGRARPHFPLGEAFDPERSQQLADEMAANVPQRFARLQRTYGRWGLAYLESLLRAADWAASAKPSQFVEGWQ